MKSKHAAKNDAAIIAGYAANRRVRDIAADLGVTRNVVIGRARRLGLSDPSRLESARSARYGVDEATETKRQWWADHPEAREERRVATKNWWNAVRSNSAAA
jgi:hypothetical protein